jgi:hypothetical protein
MEWNAIVLLGAYHGINPGMGWLFAVALGMQARNVSAVWRALPPVALGHALAVAVILAASLVLQILVPAGALKIVVASCLLGLGFYRLWRHRHPRFGGMQVGFRDLTLWSFLMASAHGAGFMLVPFVMTLPVRAMASGHDHAGHLAAAAVSPLAGAAAVGVHTIAYLVTMGLAAHIVYRKLGLAILRTAWFNLDWLWAAALVVTGVVVLVN